MADVYIKNPIIKTVIKWHIKTTMVKIKNSDSNKNKKPYYTMLIVIL